VLCQGGVGGVNKNRGVHDVESFIYGRPHPSETGKPLFAGGSGWERDGVRGGVWVMGGVEVDMVMRSDNKIKQLGGV
jgi:hypothetical protein